MPGIQPVMDGDALDRVVVHEQLKRVAGAARDDGGIDR
jgi:hypothetical protein